MRWPTRALVLVGLRFEDADAERRFAHSLRTKQLISFIILQFAYVVIAFAVAARLRSEALVRLARTFSAAMVVGGVAAALLLFAHARSRRVALKAALGMRNAARG